MLRKLTFSVLTLLLTGAMAIPARAADNKAATNPMADQPHMQTALQHIEAAQKELEAAEQNKGGHRGKALVHLNAAKAEVEAGIQYGNAHPDEPRRKDIKPH